MSRRGTGKKISLIRGAIRDARPCHSSSMPQLYFYRPLYAGLQAEKSLRRTIKRGKIHKRTSDEYLTHAETKHSRPWKIELQVNNIRLRFKIDFGDDVTATLQYMEQDLLTLAITIEALHVPHRNPLKVTENISKNFKR